MINYKKQNRIKHLTHCLIILLFCGVSSVVYAQQEPQNTMYMYNGISLNPAYAGVGGGLDAVLLHRRQWVQMAGAPTTSTLSLHSPIRGSKVAVGGSVISDEIGPVTSNYLNLYYAYHLPLSDELTLSMGLNFGLYIYDASLTGLSRNDASDPAANSDPSTTTPNGGAGLFLYHKDYYVGVSMPKVFQTDFENDRADMSELKRHLYLTAGYVFHINEEWAVKPSIYTKFVVGSPPSQDLAVQAYYHNAFSLGANYRIGDALAFIASYKIRPTLMLGYAYDINTSALNQFNSGSHEVLLSIDLGALKQSRVKSPRYF